MKCVKCLSLFTFIIGLGLAIFLSITPAEGYVVPDYKGEVVRLSPPCRLMLREGVYVGGSLGYDTYGLRQAIETIDVNGTPLVLSPLISANGFLGNVFLGYGESFCWFYMGGEIFAKYSKASGDFHFHAYDSDLNARISVGVSLLPGIKITDSTLVYLRFGYDRMRFKANERGTLLGSASRRDWSNGIDMGLGIEQALYRDFSLRGEYTYTTGSSFDTDFNTKYSPSNSEFTLGLVYHFMC